MAEARSTQHQDEPATPPQADARPAPADAPPPHKPRTQHEQVLPPGSEVYYRLRMEPFELVPATVVDTFVDEFGVEQFLRQPKPGNVHLEVQLDPARHFSASERAWRENVAEGNEPGQFVREWPKHERREFEQRVERIRIRDEENRKRAVSTV